MHQSLESAETNRMVRAYPEKEIHTIKHTGLFCIDNTGFLRLGHILITCHLLELYW